MTAAHVRANWPMDPRVAQLEEGMRYERHREYGDDSGVDKLVMLSTTKKGAKDTGPRGTNRERGFYQGPYSPNSTRKSPRSTPVRLGSRHAVTRRGYSDVISDTSSRRGTPTRRRDSMRSGSVGVIEDQDFSEVDPIVAIRRLLELSKVTGAKNFVSHLCCALADDLGTMDTIMEVRKFLHFERTRRNRVIPPPEGWETVRAALVEFHGTIRAAFTNMCAGRRGGVMSSPELHRGMITVEMPHVTECILNAVCPEQTIAPDDIFIDFEEFMWIMNGCGDQGSPPPASPRVMKDVAATAQIETPESPKEHTPVKEVRVEAKPDKSEKEKNDVVANLEARLAQLEAASSRANTSPPPELPSVPRSPSTKNVEAVKSPITSDPGKKTFPQLVSVWGDTDISSMNKRSSSPDPPKSPTYYKSPSMRPATPTRRGSTASISGSVRYTTPPKSLPPGRLPDDFEGVYPAKIPVGGATYVSRVPAPNHSFVRPPSPTASVRSARGYHGPVSPVSPKSPSWRPASPSSSRPVSPGRSGHGRTFSMGSFDGSVSRISSSIKSPVRPRGSSVTKHPGVVMPPRSRPPVTSAFDDADTQSQSGTYPYQRASSEVVATPTHHFAHQPGSPSSFKKPPGARRNSIASSVASNTVSKGPRPDPPSSSSSDEVIEANPTEASSPRHAGPGGSPTMVPASPTDRSLSPGNSLASSASVKAAPRKPEKLPPPPFNEG